MARHTRWCIMAVVSLILFFVPAVIFAQEPVSGQRPATSPAGTLHRNVSAREFGSQLAKIVKAQQEGRLLDAEKLLNTAIVDARAKSLPARQRSVLLMRLARVESELGHYSQAVATAKRGVALDEEANGLQTPRLLFDLVLLAYCNRRAGDISAGDRVLEHGVAIARERPGPRERNLLIAIRNLTSFDEQGGLEAKARAARAESIGICKAQPAPHSPMCRLVLEDFYRANGDTKDAQKIRSEETARTPRYYHGGENYSREFNMLAARAAQYERKGSYDLAVAAYRKQIALAEAHIPNPLITANAYLGLGQILELKGKKSEAEAAYKRSFDILERVQGRFRVAAIGRLSGTPLVSIYQREGRTADAEAILQRVLADQEKVLSAHDVHLALTLLQLAGMKDVDGKYSEAQALCARALEIQQADYGADNPALIPVLSAEAGILRQLGKTAKAAAVTARIKPLETRAATLHERTYADTRAFGLPLVMPMQAVAGQPQPPAPKGPLPGRVVTVSPSCSQWSRSRPPVPTPISIWYNPQAPGARLKRPESITLHLASAIGFRYDSTAIPMTRSADGAWQADFTPKRESLSGYSIFFFEDGKKRVDNNRWQYWDILSCQGGEPDMFSVIAQAKTYTGRLLAPGIERPPDLPRAIKILRDGLKRDPQTYQLYFSLWQDELKLGDESPAAYQQVGKEIGAFLKANSSNGFALQQVSDFVALQQQKLPPEVVQKFRVVASTLGISQILADFDYWAVDLEKAGLQKKAQDYLAFATLHPKNSRAGEAYSDAFSCERQLNDIAGAETVFKRWVAADPSEPYPLLSMAQLYVNRKTELDLAVKLLDKAAAIYSKDQASRRPHFYKWPGRLESLRGQAYLMLGELPAARTDLAAAVKAKPDDSELLFKLGQVCEKMGDAPQALRAYLAAASAPYVASSAPREAYERLFVAQKLGSVQDADRRISACIAESTRRAAAAYTPVPYGLPAPKFAFTEFGGKKFDNQAAAGKPTMLTFWSPG